jgi:hypothetical protein
MKQTLTILLLLLASITMQAQRFHGYGFAGAITSQVEGDELKGFDHWGLIGGVGAMADLDNNDTWSLAIETGYSCRGIYNNRHSNENFYNIRLNLHYADIPITFFYHDHYGGLRIGVGLVYSRLVSQPHDTIVFNPNYFVPDTTDMSFLKNDLAAAAEFRFNIWKGLQFSARYQYSIIPIKRDWHYQFAGNTFSNNFYGSSVTIRLLWQFGEDNRYTHSKPNKKRRR